MKTLMTAVVISAALVSTPLFANEHQESSGMQQGTMALGMMSNNKMAEMHKEMQEMQKLMATINQENAPEQRDLLMQKHMKSMQKGMGMMIGDSNAQHPKMKMDERMSMIEHRMSMMQMMMGQMMESTGQQQKQDHGHK